MLKLASITVVSYRNSTSNHNSRAASTVSAGLYLIEILHQTTTFGMSKSAAYGCILSKFYIKPQPLARVRELIEGCILSKFYIKPQRYNEASYSCWVVSYRNSTSNHNYAYKKTYYFALYLIEILHQTTTKSRFRLQRRWLYLIEILHQTTTFALTLKIVAKLYLIEILHQTTTKRWQSIVQTGLYLIEILHQTTTG